MSQALTARYRPQTFAQVAGQETIKAILSRAALEDKVAPAYLFSGTRGVGKTTIARIFAKALNCRNAPTAEPCCACDRCRAVAGGSAVDVVEIDGASNRGIDDVRRLKEDVGYAPMNGRYKIFIIDEAHMLSREAFNALLKTLEEPPRHVTFIMATTEPHKFPATIISRCQHFVFKPLPEAGLAAHLENVLQQEGLTYEPAAVRLLARRGAGSVRDSMSLLGQSLALGEAELTQDGVRSVLGLAGQEAFASLLEAVRTADTPAAVALLRTLLDQGLDMGFFLRELAQLWRNLFILRQAGEAGRSAVDLPEDETRALLAAAQNFSLTQLHASWQMTLEGGRRILTSLEPALGLELLLLNLCVLPQLLSLEQLSAIGRRTAPKGPVPAGPSGSTTPAGAPAGGGSPAAVPGINASAAAPVGAPGATPTATDAAPAFTPPAEKKTPFEPVSAAVTTQTEGRPAASQAVETEGMAQPSAPAQTGAAPLAQAAPMPIYEPEATPVPASAPAHAPVSPAQSRPAPAASSAETAQDLSPEDLEEDPADAFFDDGPPLPDLDPDDPAWGASSVEDYPSSVPTGDTASAHTADGGAPRSAAGDGFTAPADSARSASPAIPAGEASTSAPTAGTDFLPSQAAPCWEDLTARAVEMQAPPWFNALTRAVAAESTEDGIHLSPRDGFIAERLTEPAVREVLTKAAVSLYGRDIPVQVGPPPREATMSRKELEAEVRAHPVVRAAEGVLSAQLIDFGR